MQIAARAGAWSGSQKIPAGYVEVEFLQSNGLQFIDTGITFSRDITKAEIVFAVVKKLTLDFYFGLDWDYNSLCCVNNWGNFGLPFFNNTYDNTVAVDPLIRKKLILKVDGNVLSFYNEKILLRSIVSGKPLTSQKTFRFFNTSIGGSYKAQMMLFSAKAYESETRQFDLIPVRFTNENGETEGALYDFVSGQLFRNQGTGVFIIGPDKTT